MTAQKPLWKKLFSGSGWTLFTVFIWELMEEGLEELIAFAITNALAVFITKALSTVVIITMTQGLKILLKNFVKKLTYKEGNDKMTKVKKFFSFIGKGFKWVFANKKSLTGIASGAVMTLCGTGVIDVNTLPALDVSGFNITPVLFYGVLLLLAIIGVSGKGFESIKTYLERIAGEKAVKQENAIIKEAQAELKAEQKLANQTQAQKEKDDAKKLAEEKAKAEKAKADAEHKAKVQQAKAKILAGNNK